MPATRHLLITAPPPETLPCLAVAGSSYANVAIRVATMWANSDYEETN